MAIQHLVPSEVVNAISLKDARTLLAKTPHPVSLSTLKRWIPKYGLATRRIDGVIHVDFSELLQAQRDDADAKAAAAAAVAARGLP